MSMARKSKTIPKTIRFDTISIACIEIEMKFENATFTQATKNLILQGHFAKEEKKRTINKTSQAH